MSERRRRITHWLIAAEPKKFSVAVCVLLHDLCNCCAAVGAQLRIQVTSALSIHPCDVVRADGETAPEVAEKVGIRRIDTARRVDVQCNVALPVGCAAQVVRARGARRSVRGALLSVRTAACSSSTPPRLVSFNELRRPLCQNGDGE